MSREIQLENVVESHTLIETKNKNSNDWVRTIVMNIHGEFLEVSQVEEYITSVLMIGDTLECRIVNNDTITMMNAEIYNIKFASCSIVLKVNSMQTIQNMRKHKRYDIFLSATFSKNDEMYENYCVVVNISLSGLSIITRSQLNKGDIIDLNINCKKIHFLTTECNVEWAVQSERNYFCGLSIMNMDEKTKILYHDFIKKLQKHEQVKSQKLDQVI